MPNIKAWDCFVLLLNFPSMCFLLERQLPILSHHILRGRAEFHITKKFMMFWKEPNIWRCIHLWHSLFNYYLSCSKSPVNSAESYQWKTWYENMQMLFNNFSQVTLNCVLCLGQFIWVLTKLWKFQVLPQFSSHFIKLGMTLMSQAQASF